MISMPLLPQLPNAVELLASRFGPLYGRGMAFTDHTFSVTVNGQHRRVPAGITIADLALELGLEPTRVAVERNLEIVPRSTLGQVQVEDGDDYEIVTFVGGG
jgi:thiazole synthase